MEPYIIMPAFREKGVFSHEGEEFMYVLEGRHEFIYNGKKYLLHEGDSIYFDSIVPHTGRSVGKKKAKILAVMYSYKRK
jgi:mannose-6-phosphate isomerase-like protein (cupin superfamily)